MPGKYGGTMPAGLDQLLPNIDARRRGIDKRLDIGSIVDDPIIIARPDKQESLSSANASINGLVAMP